MSSNPNIPPPPPTSLKPEDLIPNRKPGEFQEADIVAAEKMPGFEQAEVFFTLEKKKEAKYFQKKNQDNILVDPETGLLGVMDGLGGMGNGDIASMIAEQVLPEEYAQALTQVTAYRRERLKKLLLQSQTDKIRGLPDEERRLKKAERMVDMVIRTDPGLAKKALALILALRKTNGAVADAGGMTTACVGLIHRVANGKRYAIIANIGDSAAYIRRADGRLERLTHEDSAYESLMRHGILIDGLPLKDYIDLHRDPLTDKIDPRLNIPIPLTPESCRALGYGPDEYGTQKNLGHTHINLKYADLMVTVLDSLGGTVPPIPSLEIVGIQEGDELIFCTDGLVDKYENPRTGETDLEELGLDMTVGNTPKERLDNLRTLTKQRRTYKLDDDIAIVMARVK
jgi:serine/threonine protein phosphatase PrpC